MVVWMSEAPLDPGKTYLVKHTTRYLRTRIDEVRWRSDLNTLEQVPADTLGLNDIGCVALTCHRALYFDAYAHNRATGAFILIDTLTNNTVAAGMIREAEQGDAAGSGGAGTPVDPAGILGRSGVSEAERARRLKQRGTVVWLTGLTGAGKSAVAYALERRLFDLGWVAHVLDEYDAVLGKMASVREAAHAAYHVARAGVIAICALVTPTRADRQAARSMIGADRFFQVWVDTSVETCKARDQRGRYEGADPTAGFEAPKRAELRVSLDDRHEDEVVEAIIALLRERGLLEESP